MDEEKILPSPEPEIPVPTEMPELSVDSEQQVSTEPQEVSLEDIPTEMSELTIRLPVIEPQEEPSEYPALADILETAAADTDESIGENNVLTAEAEQWLNDLLSEPSAVTEPESIRPEDTTVSDAELEQIIQETQSTDFDVDESVIEAQLASEQSAQNSGSEAEAPLDDDALLEQLLNEPSVLDAEANTEQGPEAPITAPSTTDALSPDPLEKGRPKRKQGYGLFGLPHLAATAVWLAIILAIGVSIGRMVWICAADVLALGREPISVTISIAEDDDIYDVANKLKEAGLIRYPGLFKLYADITDAMEDIRPGTYTLNPPDAEEDQKNIVYDYMALVSVMSPHSPAQVVVSDLRIPEGYTCAQIFQLLEEKKVCTAAELETYVASLDAASLDYWFLEGVQWGDKYSLEGYLFPNTYDFYENDKPERVIRKLLDSFEANFTAVMKADLEALNDRLAEMYRKNGYGNSFIETHKYTIREVIIIASMIEKETANNLESFTVSSVIYNRLTDPNNYPFLNIDATLVYALGGKSDLTEEDLKLDHPFNTYTNPGLTPGAISNPSQNSIAAALDPSDTTFYFYAFDPSTGEHHFSSTYQEHLDFLASLKEAQ